MIASKIHRAYRSVVALCDTELIGKYFEEGKFQLDLRENFFKDQELTHDEVVSLIKDQAKEDSTFNIVGPKAIKAALEAGLITKENVAHIATIPYTLILL